VKTYPTEQMLEFAYAAYRVNNGYVKSTYWDYETDTNHYSNKDMVSYSAAIQFGDPDLFIPSGFKILEVVDEDRENVALAQKHFRRYSFLILGTDLTDFQKNVFSAISGETTDRKKFGLIASVPSVVKNEIETIAYTRLLKDQYSDSKHYTQKEVTGVVEILKRIFLKDYATYIYIAGIDGNLVSFTKPEKMEIGAVYQLRGRFKSKEFERNTNIPLTKINYVKLSVVEIEDAG
jgi:hypothetical protein